ncbi:MAG: uracil-DNA glycosylase [Hydrogenophilales bacterium]|nr:uracil-DNA glycosylase [Hydrogenophilales bacterium]
MNPASFSIACTDCPRLSNFLGQIRISHPDYFARPVPPFGVNAPRLLIVGLAPGMHGANRTGRPFTGDFAGILLYETLHRYGFASRPLSEHADDGLQLIDCRITNAVKCLPPENKPDTSEIKICNKYLSDELKVLDESVSILALGLIAHKAVLMALGLKQGDYAFGHAAEHHLPNGLVLFDSYHCSRYNTQTRRLTPAMFQAVFERIRDKIESENTGEPRMNTDAHG